MGNKFTEPEIDDSQFIEGIFKLINCNIPLEQKWEHIKFYIQKFDYNIILTNLQNNKFKVIYYEKRKMSKIYTFNIIDGKFFEIKKRWIVFNRNDKPVILKNNISEREFISFLLINEINFIIKRYINTADVKLKINDIEINISVKNNKFIL